MQATHWSHKPVPLLAESFFDATFSQSLRTHYVEINILSISLNSCQKEHPFQQLWPVYSLWLEKASRIEPSENWKIIYVYAHTHIINAAVIHQAIYTVIACVSTRVRIRLAATDSLTCVVHGSMSKEIYEYSNENQVVPISAMTRVHLG